MNNMQKKRASFYLSISDIVKKTVHSISKDNYAIQTYFTGRDDDYFGVDLKSCDDNEILQFYIVLRNHSYELDGSEKVIFSKLSKINGKYTLQGPESVFFLNHVPDAQGPKERLQNLIFSILSNRSQ
jgi:hypothetical protein